MRASSSEASGSSISSRRGLGEQRPADGDALLLAARQPARPALEQAADAEQVDHPLEVVAALARRREPAAVEQVLPHGQVREQPPLLEHVADPAPVRAARTCRARCRPAPRRRCVRGPASGRISPAMTLTIEVLPAPDRPNSAISPLPVSKRGIEQEARRAGAGCRRPSVIRCRAGGWRGAPSARRRAAPAWRSRSTPASGAGRRHRRPAPA